MVILWLKKCSLLLKFFHRMDSKREIPVSTLRAFKKQGHKLVKLQLDIKYFKSYLNLDLCPEFLKFKPLNLSVYKMLNVCTNLFREKN